MAQDDKFGRHEILHTAYIIQEMVWDHLYDHGGMRPDEKVLAERAARALMDLYQLVGTRQDEDDDDK